MLFSHQSTLLQCSQDFRCHANGSHRELLMLVAGVPQRDALETAGAQLVSDCCRAALKQYPRPLAEEQEFLANANKRAGEAGGVGGDRDTPTQAAAKRAFWASSIRVQEQKILHRTIFILQDAHGVSAAKRVLAQRT